LPSNSPKFRLGAVLAVAALIGFVAWLVLRDDDSSSESDATTGPVEASVDDLRDVAQSSNTPIYWAGALEGRTIELTETASGRVFVRYLPGGVDVGAQEGYLSIGTYPLQNGYQAVRAAGQRPGAQTTRIEDGGLLVGSNRGDSVHFSFPGAAYQVEVFHPDRGTARRLVLDGEIQRVR
jgi:hypothetical protein